MYEILHFTLILDLKNYFWMQYNARTKHLHPNAHKHCTRGTTMKIAHTATARLCRHACEVVSDKASKLLTQTQSSKYCR